MSEYKPLELSPALEWLVAQAATNPKAVEDGNIANDLIMAMPELTVSMGQIDLFSDVFDNSRMAAVMREFWTIYREEKAAGNIREVGNPEENPWA